MGDRLALVGRPRGRRGAIQRKRQVGAGEGAKSKVGGNLASVIKPGLGAAAIVPECRRRHANLVGKVVQQPLGYSLAGTQAEAGVAQQAELHGEAKAVVGAVPVRREFQVGRGQGVVAESSASLSGRPKRRRRSSSLSRSRRAMPIASGSNGKA